MKCLTTLLFSWLEREKNKETALNNLNCCTWHQHKLDTAYKCSRLNFPSEDVTDESERSTEAVYRMMRRKIGFASVGRSDWSVSVRRA